MNTIACRFSNILNLPENDRHELYDAFKPLIEHQFVDEEQTFMFATFADKSSLFLDIPKDTKGIGTCTLLEDTDHPEQELLSFLIWMAETKPQHPFSKLIKEFFHEWGKEITAHGD